MVGRETEIRSRAVPDGTVGGGHLPHGLEAVAARAWRSPSMRGPGWGAWSATPSLISEKMPIAEVTSADMIGILTPIWHEKGRHRPEAAPAHPRGPGVGRGDGSSARQPRATGSVRCSARRGKPCVICGALPHTEVAEALRAVWASKVRPVVKLAFEFLVLTATRSGEVRGAGLDGDRPEQGCVDHPRRTHERVSGTPGSRSRRRALEILEGARVLGRGNRLVFL